MNRLKKRLIELWAAGCDEVRLPGPGMEVLRLDRNLRTDGLEVSCDKYYGEDLDTLEADGVGPEDLEPLWGPTFPQYPDGSFRSPEIDAELNVSGVETADCRFWAAQGAIWCRSEELRGIPYQVKGPAVFHKDRYEELKGGLSFEYPAHGNYRRKPLTDVRGMDLDVDTCVEEGYTMIQYPEDPTMGSLIWVYRPWPAYFENEAAYMNRCLLDLYRSAPDWCFGPWSVTCLFREEILAEDLVNSWLEDREEIQRFQQCSEEYILHMVQMFQAGKTDPSDLLTAADGLLSLRGDL